ncbi:MAG: hypothetical protein V3R99_10935 [Thermoguttaceae bacterium]
MGAFRLDQILDSITGAGALVTLLWLGLAILTVMMLVLMQTRWGQARPLRKCIILSLLAHLLLVGYATTVQIVSAEVPPEEEVMRVTFVENRRQSTDIAEESVPEQTPWEQLLHNAVVQPDRPEVQREPIPLPAEPQRDIRNQQTNLPEEPRLDHLAMARAEQPQPKPATASGSMGRPSPGKATPEQIEAPRAQRREATRAEVPEQADPERPSTPPLTKMTPVRVPSAGLPSALLQHPVPLPRMATQPTTADPAGSLASLRDQLSTPTHREPAETAHRDVDPAYGEAERALPAIEHRTDISAVPAPSEDLQGPGADPGLPNADVAILVPLNSRRDQSEGTPRRIPGVYSLRTAPDRQRQAKLHGATTETEAAVKAALKWLADNQSPDGRWNAAQYGAGQERLVLGRRRQSAGIQADTGITGLTLLAFLASGHTHREGAYRENVLRGLQFLLSIQAEDGSLGGQATPFAKMYCHGMAALALSEAYGMTGDQRLREPVRRAIDYTIRAQDPSLGGFRYNPGDRGDTSQCGWQLMALKSAELAGIRVPVATKNGVIRYLRSVASGTHGGLASYRAGERVSRPMTAEALVCWQFLGIPREHPALSEAGNYLLGELPGKGEDNLYYWYYATLGMYQLQGPHWQRWNEALQETLLSRQQESGPTAGSWEPNTVWGGYGGRVFTTAMATLCLEVYYRFLPLYVDAAPKEAPPQ